MMVVISTIKLLAKFELTFPVNIASKLKRKHIIQFIKREDGFTLIEIAIVIVVIGILYFIWGRPDADIGVGSLYAGSKQLQADINAVRDRAIRTKRRQKLIFVVSASSFSLYGQHSTNNVWVDHGTTLPLGAGVTLAFSDLANMQVVFDALGQPYEDPQGDAPLAIDVPLTVTRQIVLEHGSNQRTLYIVPDTGFVSELQ